MKYVQNLHRKACKNIKTESNIADWYTFIAVSWYYFSKKGCFSVDL